MSVTLFFESILEDEVWIKFKIDPNAAQFVAHGLNHEMPILVNYFRDHLYPTQLEHTEVSDCILVTTLPSEEQNSINN